MIKRIHVQNFKSLQDLHLDLGSRNVLVGPNMAGKSNILDVFRFLSQMLAPGPSGNGIVSAFSVRNGFLEVAWKGEQRPGSISFLIEGDVPELLTAGAYTKWEYKFSVLGNVSGWITLQDEQLTVAGPKGKAELIDKRDGQRVVLNSDGRVLSHVGTADRSALELEIPDWEGTAIRRYFQFFRFYRLIPVLMKQANAASAASFLNEHGDNLGAWLMTLQTRHQQSFVKIQSAAKDVFPEVANLFTFPTQQATVYLGSTEKYLKRPVSVWQMSEGELTFIALLSLIFAPLELGGSLYCVEEPESHLHPRLLEALIGLHNQVRQELGANAGQVIMTTHSPKLVDMCDLEDLIVVERQSGATVCTRPRDKAHLRDLLSNEEIGLGTLFFSGALSSAE